MEKNGSKNGVKLTPTKRKKSGQTNGQLTLAVGTKRALVGDRPTRKEVNGHIIGASIGIMKEK